MLADNFLLFKLGEVSRKPARRQAKRALHNSRQARDLQDQAIDSSWSRLYSAWRLCALA
jgi:hypothetical protein